MTTAWAALPNATHIDWLLASLKSDPQIWTVAWDAARDAARDAAWDAARDAAWDACAALIAWGAARDAARAAVWGACAALIAWDDCAVLLDMPADAVRLLAHSGHHPAVLLLPAVIVRNGD